MLLASLVLVADTVAVIALMIAALLAMLALAIWDERTTDE